MLGGGNPFPMGGMTPIQTASGQIQYQMAGGFAGGNQMDLLFNRKVVKPIRGGGAPAGNNDHNRRGSSREASMGRSGRPNAQMTFDQFM